MIGPMRAKVGFCTWPVVVVGALAFREMGWVGSRNRHGREGVK